MRGDEPLDTQSRPGHEAEAFGIQGVQNRQVRLSAFNARRILFEENIKHLQLQLGWEFPSGFGVVCK